MKTLLAAILGLTVLGGMPHAQAGQAGAPAAETAGPADSLTPQNSVLLLIDHQVGLSQLVRDMTPDEFRNNVLGLARAAKALNIPVVITTSRDWGPNGPLFPELAKLFPQVQVVRRTGVIDAYRWPEFRHALEATGRRHVVVAAISDSTCLQFAALDMVHDGYVVHGVVDASGAVSAIEREATIATLAQAGVRVRNWWSVMAEWRADWRRDEAAGWPVAATLPDSLPTYGWLMDTAAAYAQGTMTPPK